MELIMPWCRGIIHHWSMCTVEVFLQGPLISREDFCLSKANKFYIFQENMGFFPEVIKTFREMQNLYYITIYFMR